ncbi:MAG: hypothetical protein K2W95_35780 [Candidatus Obscuribacterales bacterium]|nr:hypothetical protein [Candidatus Obscuribacterales bacterium]
MSGKAQLKHTTANVARSNDLRELLAGIPGTESCILDHVSPGIFEVTGEMDDDGREAIRIATSDEDCVPDALNMNVILNWLCAEGHMASGTWIILT